MKSYSNPIRFRVSGGFYFFMLAGILLFSIVIHDDGLPEGSLNSRNSRLWGRHFTGLPIWFEPNAGQADGQVRFLARGQGYTLALKADAVVLYIRESGEDSRFQKSEHGSDINTAKPVKPSIFIPKPKPAVVHIRLAGANTYAEATGMEVLPGRSHYFMGRDPEEWHTDIPNFARIRFDEVYNGIDMEYYGREGRLEFDFIVSPEGDPDDIVLQLDAEKTIQLDRQGNLVLSMDDSEICMKPPVAYQLREGERNEVRAAYKVTDDGQIGFDLGDYDPAQPLVIDPVLVYSTYLGGTGFDRGQDIAVDSLGNYYITGATSSWDFPVAAGQSTPSTKWQQDVFIVKMNLEGSSILYSAFVGGKADDVGIGIAVDREGYVSVAGKTKSNNFPMQNAHQSTFGGDGLNDGDGFVLRLNPSGSALIYSTYLGGEYEDIVWDIAVDHGGTVYVTGETNSSNFPVKNALQGAHSSAFNSDAFVSKINPSGSVLFSSYLGGPYDDWGRGIAVDRAGSIYVTGKAGNGFTTTGNAFQTGSYGLGEAFVTKLNAQGSAMVYSTFLGGTTETGNEEGMAIAIDSAGYAYIAGRTPSTDFPTMNPVQSERSGSWGEDGFVSKLTPDGSALVFSTYLGGNHFESELDIALDRETNVYVSGYTQSSDFPTMNALKTYLGGNNDAFLAKISSSGSALLFSSYIGGSGFEGGIDQRVSIAVSRDGYIIMTGYTTSVDFPVVNPFQDANRTADAFIVKMLIDEKGKLVVTPDPVVFPLTLPGQTSTESVELANAGSKPLEIQNIDVEPSTLFVIEDNPSMPFTLDPGENVDIEITYTPASGVTMKQSAAAPVSGTGTLVIVSDGEIPITAVDLKTTGVIVNDIRDLPDADPYDERCDADPDDPGDQCTLRAAIQHVNAMKVESQTKVYFALPGNEIHYILPESELPRIEYPVDLDGSTQDGRYMVLDGRNAGQDATGLIMETGGNILKWMNIQAFGRIGVMLNKHGDNRIEKCVINGNGAASGKLTMGIGIQQSGNNQITGNVISGNIGSGIFMLGEQTIHNLIMDNTIGLKASGLEELPNSENGILLSNGASYNDIVNNIISGNASCGIVLGKIFSVDIPPSHNTISQNRIGVDAQIQKAIGNGMDGIFISGWETDSNTVDSNIIAGNELSGIHLCNASYTQIQFNDIGIDGNGMKAIGNNSHGIEIEGGDRNTITGNVIADSKDHGIYVTGFISSRNWITGNFIGLNRQGENTGSGLGNMKSGIYLSVGHPEIKNNEIANNSETGITVLNTSEGVIERNRIHDNQTGLELRDSNPRILQNDIYENKTGILMDQASEESVILEGNSIYGNYGSNTGIHIMNSRAVIRGNSIRNNGGNGITVEGESLSLVSGNNISGNTFGLNNESPSFMVGAQVNWWGDASGPGGTGSGTGNGVSGGVDFSNWRQDMVSVVISTGLDTVKMPVGEFDTVFVYLRNWADPGDILSLTFSDEKGWRFSQGARMNILNEDWGGMEKPVFRIPAGTASGTLSRVTITATSWPDPVASDTLRFLIQAEKAGLRSLQVTPDSATIAPGDSVRFYAIGYDQFYRSALVDPDWSCTGGVIDNEGLFVAGSTTGTFWITATDPFTGLNGYAQVVISTTLDVEGSWDTRSSMFHLSQNYPNPFNPFTIIHYSLPVTGNIRLDIYDLSGRKVRTLIASRQAPGYYQAEWNARDDVGEAVASGVYIYRLSTGEFVQSRKMLLIR